LDFFAALAILISLGTQLKILREGVCMIDEVAKKLSAHIKLEDKDIAELIDAYRDQQALIDIGKSLIEERDTDTLLRIILSTSERITGADAGSIFLVEHCAEGTFLRFAYSHTHSIDVDYGEFRMPVDHMSIAGWVSLQGEILNIPDVYEIGMDKPYQFKRFFDTTNGYRTKSMLAIPMRKHDGEIIGVIQLINSKEDPENPDADVSSDIVLATPEDYEIKVKPFNRRYEALMEAVANQAAIALENSRMIEQIRQQFDAFVRASVFAIESRDPSTKGHSIRVASTTVALAKAVNAVETGTYGHVAFSETELKELEYAGLLHDFGKVYIDPHLFLKAKKLYPEEFEYLMLRIGYLKQTIELGYQRLEHGSRHTKTIASEHRLNLTTIMEASRLVSLLNEPSAVTQDIDADIQRLQHSPFPDFAIFDDGKTIPLITDTEANALRIRKGSLTETERKLIQDHVIHTWEFVSKIPWPPEFAHIPEYCRDHHEMLDGSGYPRGLKGGQIGLQARMLAVCDIYDALSASDRPYKKALPIEVCKKILCEEAGAGRLDADLVKIFLDAKVHEAVVPYIDPDRAPTA